MDTDVQTEVQIPEELIRDVISSLDWTDYQEWIPWAWGVLTRAGDVPAVIDDDDLDYASYVVTLAALGRLFDIFQDVADGLNERDTGLETDLTGYERPYITDIEIARYCERHGYYEEDFPETGTGLFAVAVAARVNRLKTRLLEILGDARLYTSLFASGEMPEPEDYDYEDEDTADSPRPEPLGRTASDDAFDVGIDAVMNGHLTPDKHRSYEWLTEGA